MKNKKDHLIYEEETYQIIGCAFDVYNTVGYGHKEQFYQNALAADFREKNIEYEEQLKVKVRYKNSDIGYYVYDFLVFGKIVVEIKKRNYFSKKDIEQLYAYLKAKDLKLGLIVHFTNTSVRHKRVVNIK